MSRTATIESAVAQTEGLPRRNGELAFDAPWEARAFGVAVALCRAQGLDWDAFRHRLTEEIRDWDGATGSQADGWSYYEHWLASLERLVVETGLVSPAELEHRTALVAMTVAHEHEHDGDEHHNHHHDHHH